MKKDLVIESEHNVGINDGWLSMMVCERWVERGVLRSRHVVASVDCDGIGVILEGENNIVIYARNSTLVLATAPACSGLVGGKIRSLLRERKSLLASAPSTKVDGESP